MTCCRIAVVGRVAQLLGFGLVAGCIDPGHFVCTGEGDCGVDGRCVAGSCVVADASCPSLERYSKYAEDGLAGACFEGEDPSSSSITVASVDDTSSSSEGSSSDASTSTESSSSGSSSSTGEPKPTEVCNGIDDNDNGLVDEWSVENVECEICPDDFECNDCDLFPDDEANPTRVYYMCHGANYDEVVSYCEALDAPAASIHSDAENTYLAIKVVAHALYSTAYIGLRDFGPVGTPMWTWVDGTPFEYERLGDQLETHEPDDVCVALLASGEWEAAHCNGGRTFICEALLPDP